MCSQTRRGGRGLPQYRGAVPELPEVEALAARPVPAARRARHRPRRHRCVQLPEDLRPADHGPRGGMVDGVTRHGKFLDIDAGRHPPGAAPRPGRLGPVEDEVPKVPARPNSKSPLAARIVLDNGAGLDITEAGTRKSLALYVVRDPAEVEGIARLGPDPLADDFTIDVLARDPRAGRTRPDQGRAAAARATSPASATPTPTSCCTPRGCRRSSRPTASTTPSSQTLYDAIRTVLGDAVTRSDGPGRQRAQGREEEQHGRARPHRRDVPGLRRRRPRGELRRLEPAVLRDLPDRRQAARGPHGCPSC